MRILWLLLICACLALTGHGDVRDEGAIAPESTAAPMLEDTLELLPASPEREGSHENYVESVQGLLTAAQTTYDRLVSAAEDARELYGARLTELAATDLAALSDEELRALMLELSDALAALCQAG